MATLAENVGLLMRIRADSSDAQKDLNKFRSELKQIDKAAKDAATPLEQLAGRSGLSAAQFSNLKTGAVAAVAGITAVAAVAATTAVTFFNLAQSAAEYGSAIFDAQEKTGLSAATLSTLKLAADSSGASFEAISGAVSKFSVLIGQANQGKEKAIEMLQQYGIKSRDLNGALEESIALIANETDETVQAAIAKDLFKDKTGAVIPIVKALDGSLAAATLKAQQLGLTLSEDDVRAADKFGDAFDVVSMQVKAGASRFALQYAPQITDALQSITTYLAANQQKWGQWGSYVTDIIRGTGSALSFFGQLADNQLKLITFGLASNAQRWSIWATSARIAIGVVTAGISELIQMMAYIGNMQGQAAAPTVSIGDMEFDPVTNTMQPAKAQTVLPNQWRPGSSLISMANAGGGKGGGGGGRGGGGKPPKDNSAQEAEERRRKAVQEAQAEMQDTLGIYKAGYAERLALLDFNLAQKFTSELNYIRDVGRINLEALLDEKRLNEELLKNENLNVEEKKDIANKIKILEIKIRTEKTKTATKVIEQINKENEAAEEAHKKELKRLQEISDKRQKDFAAYQNRRQERLRQERLEQTVGSGQEIGALDQLMKSAVSSQNTAAIASLQALSTAFQGLGQAIGQVVSAWVLYGSAGTSVRKVTAQILAGIAQQAAIQAVFQLAEGFAKLAMAYFGVPNAGPSATAHFIAAGMYASIAGVAAVAGRAVAGNAFKSQTASATGGGSSGGNGSGANNEPNRYTTEFGGYGQGRNNALVRIMDRVNTTLGMVEETQHKFNQKVLGMSPTDVVVLGANGASREIRGAVESELSSDVGATDAMMRGLGFAR